MNIYKDKTSWITGASSGIGEELCYILNEYGCKTIISSRREAELQRVKGNCKFPELVFVQVMDLENTDELFSIVEECLLQHKKIDYLFNNGGVSQRSYVPDTSIETARKIMEINFFGNIALTKALLPYMINQKGGHIIITSSAAGKYGFYLRSVYSASKHALHGFYESLRLEQKENNIYITLIISGPVNTNMSFNAMTGNGKNHGKQDRLINQGANPKTIAIGILKATKKGKEEAYFGGKELIPIYIKRFFPRFFTRLLAKFKP